MERPGGFWAGANSSGPDHRFQGHVPPHSGTARLRACPRSGFRLFTANADTLTWTNLAGGTWNTAANWSPNKVPVAGDTALITTPGTYAVTNTAAASVATLQVGAASGTQTLRLNAGSLTVSGTATLASNTRLEWAGGSLAGAGSLTADGEFHLLTTADRTLSAFRISTRGATAWTGTGRVLGSSGARWNQEGTLSVDSATGFVWAGSGAGPAFVNSGSVTVGANFNFSSANVTNAGSINIAAGTTVLTSCNFQHSGTLAVGAAAILGLDTGTDARIEGSVTAPAADSFRIRGGDVSLLTGNLSTPSLWLSSGAVRQLVPVTIPRFNQSGGTWWMTTPSTIATYALTNGTFRGQGLVATNVLWSDGAINRDGDNSQPVITVPPSGTFTLSGTADRSLSTYDATKPGHLLVQGTTTWGGASRILGAHNSRLELAGTSTVTGNSGFVWAGAGAAPALINSGSITFATNFTFATANATNLATWTLVAGTQTYSGSSIRQEAGTFTLGDARVTGSASSATFSGGTLTGNGEFGIPFANTGATVIPGGSPGVLQFPSFNQTAGVLSVEVGRGIPGTNSDLIRVTGPATVGGTLRVRLLPGVGTNDQFTVVTTTARTGTFGTVEQPPNGTVEAAYSTTNVVLNLKALFDGAAPSIVQGPTNRFVAPGTATTFTVVATGNEPLQYQWSREGIDIPGATGASLTVSNVQCDTDTGLYRVRISNDLGNITSEPAMLGLNLPAVDAEGFRAWFACTLRNPTNTDPDWDYVRLATSRDTAYVNGAWRVDTDVNDERIYWRKSGVNARFPTNGIIEFSLRMGPGATANGARGWANVVFTRGDGRLAALHFTNGQLWFNTADLTAGTKIATPTSDDFHTYRLEFNGLPGADRAIRLFKDGALLTTGTMFGDGTRTEPSLSFGDGSLLARGLSDWKFFRHTTGDTSLLAFVSQPVSTNVAYGNPVTFTAAATGAGTVRYQWRRNGIDLANQTNAAYAIASATTGGQFSVRVEDDYDILTSTNGVLTITGGPTQPVFTLQPASQTVPAGAIVTFTAEAAGNPPPTYQWTSNNNPIAGATSSTLVLNGVTAASQGNYRVTASNSAGTANSQVAALTIAAGVAEVPVANPGIPGRLNSITFLNALFGFVTGDNGAFRYTINGGLTWLTSIPGDPNRITGAAFYGGAYWISGSGGLLCVSYDNGRTWIPFNTGVTEDFYGIAFDRNGTGFAVGARGTICVYRNGVWTAATGIPGDVDFYGVYTVGGVAWAVGSGGTICVYRNGGWTAANTGGFSGIFYGVAFWDANYGFAVGGGGTICVTRNGGGSWTPVNTGTSGDFLSVSFASANVIFAGGRGGLLCVSLNGGTSWIPISSGTNEDITSVFWRDGQGYYVDAAGNCRAFRYAGFVPNLPPTVRILNPTNWFSFETNVVSGEGGILLTNVTTIRHDYTNIACVPIPFRAVASDPDDAVFAVELYINGYPIDNDPANPVEHFWDNCTPGRYWLAALAVDTRGAVAYSENIAITVLPPLHILVPSIRPDGLVRLCYAGDTNKAYGVEFSMDLDNWTYLGPFFPTNSILQYLDGPTTTAPHRLYRAVEIPMGP